MAVGPGLQDTLLPVAGVRIGTASAGIRKKNRRDLVVFELAAGSNVAAVFTTNRFCAAPVQVAREHLRQGAPRYLLVNTGNANAGTGTSGLANARRSCDAVAALTKVTAQQVLPFSTGVIGEPLPVDRIEAGLPAALQALEADAWTLAAEGIMTTDTRPKGACRQIVVNGKTVTITGISKGAGMIKPNMATMLGFVATDAVVDASLLQELLRETTESSFNAITIDGDTSTNDACVLVATGQSGASVSREQGLDSFRQALHDVLVSIAQQIVRDGEGATKFVSVQVSGGKTVAECRQAAFTVAESPLVKTALFASDPNWGRILAALGRAGIDDLDVTGVNVHLNGVLIAERGGRAASYTEEAGVAAMKPEEIVIAIDLGRGQQQATVWTCDFSYDYVKINAEYRS
ncbi:MAG: bifunctional glutamate N-acetyltransferase/amino-acid acetyltransferase ArgJ [Gammaproteobacteria bacterium]|nr:MAG: bifunctional glutamate N-acetyltransferase/amino-acid acetyltransferase ArgJ [Gammaproteobacteria bacterium]